MLYKEHVMILWNLLDGGLSHSKLLLEPSESSGVVPRVPALISSPECLVSE
jgi:hypothetical protein